MWIKVDIALVVNIIIVYMDVKSVIFVRLLTASLEIVP